MLIFARVRYMEYFFQDLQSAGKSSFSMKYFGCVLYCIFSPLLINIFRRFPNFLQISKVLTTYCQTKDFKSYSTMTRMFWDKVLGYFHLYLAHLEKNFFYHEMKPIKYATILKNNLWYKHKTIACTPTHSLLVFALN